MKVLVYAHRLELGGTQVNAIELAAALRDRHGHDVAVFATPGPLEGRVHELGLRFLPAPDARLHPSRARMDALRAIVERERPDVVHAWDWWQAMDAYFSVHLPLGQPLLVSDMMMTLTRLLPRRVPVTFGVPALREEAARAGWRHARELLPPVDVIANAPGAVDGDDFRRRFGAGAGRITVVTVSRLANVLKLDSLVRSIEAVRRLGDALPVRLVLVGDGAARPALEARAGVVNAELGREAVTFAGPMFDPRPAYEAADVVVGMGGSALRAMAFAKPTVVVGEGGFARPFAPETAPGFHRHGMYGVADAPPDDVDALVDALAWLGTDAGARRRLGAFGRRHVERHHALDVVADGLARLCETAAALPPARGGAMLDAVRTGLVYLRERRFSCASRDLVPGDARR